jgi:hypothetical protein
MLLIILLHSWPLALLIYFPAKKITGIHTEQLFNYQLLANFTYVVVCLKCSRGCSIQVLKPYFVIRWMYKPRGCLEDGGSKLLRKDGNYLETYVKSYPTRFESPPKPQREL